MIPRRRVTLGRSLQHLPSRERRMEGRARQGRPDFCGLRGIHGRPRYRVDRAVSVSVSRARKMKGNSSKDALWSRAFIRMALYALSTSNSLSACEKGMYHERRSRLIDDDGHRCWMLGMTACCRLHSSPLLGPCATKSCVSGVHLLPLDCHRSIFRVSDHTRPPDRTVQD